MKRNCETIGEYLHWAYANLAMAHAALTQQAERYGRLHYSIRSKLFAGLRHGTMQIGTITDDERLKLIIPQACSYCGSHNGLSVDHLIPRKRGGEDNGENLVWACRACNSSKGASDMLDWLWGKGMFPSILLLRRYLKIAIAYCVMHDMMDCPITASQKLPFSLNAIPHDFPNPSELKLWVIPLKHERAVGAARCG